MHVYIHIDAQPIQPSIHPVDNMSLQTYGNNASGCGPTSPLVTSHMGEMEEDAATYGNAQTNNNVKRRDMMMEKEMR